MKLGPLAGAGVLSKLSKAADKARLASHFLSAPRDHAQITAIHPLHCQRQQQRTSHVSYPPVFCSFLPESTWSLFREYLIRSDPSLFSFLKAQCTTQYNLIMAIPTHLLHGTSQTHFPPPLAPLTTSFQACNLGGREGGRK